MRVKPTPSRLRDCFRTINPAGLQTRIVELTFEQRRGQITKIEEPSLFRFVLDPKFPPTNNAAKRRLREIVVHRKIRGGIRAKETMTWMANFFSYVMTWKNKELDHLADIAKYV